MPFVSVVSPVYGCAGLIPELVRQLTEVLTPITQGDFEIVLVNDASPDGAWNAICAVAETEPRVRGVNLSRNFGQHAAITAGLAYAQGEWVVVMDCDLQDRPDQIPLLYQHAVQHNLHIVQAQRQVRQDGFAKKAFSRAFYGVLSWLTGTTHDPSIANFGIYHRKAIQALLDMPERTRYFPTQIGWVGFRRGKLPVLHAARAEGKSSYNLKKLLRLALDIILVNSDKPLRMTAILGFSMASLSFVMSLALFVRYLLGQYTVSGYASIIVSIWFLAGLIIMILGMVGLYIGKIFDAVKQRPVYLVSETTWDEATPAAAVANPAATRGKY